MGKFQDLFVITVVVQMSFMLMVVLSVEIVEFQSVARKLTLIDLALKKLGAIFYKNFKSFYKKLLLYEI